MLVKSGALIVMSNKYGDTPLSKARPRLRKKLEGRHARLLTHADTYTRACTHTHTHTHTRAHTHTHSHTHPHTHTQL